MMTRIGAKLFIIMIFFYLHLFFYAYAHLIREDISKIRKDSAVPSVDLHEISGERQDVLSIQSSEKLKTKRKGKKLKPKKKDSVTAVTSHFSSANVRRLIIRSRKIKRRRISLWLGLKYFFISIIDPSCGKIFDFVDEDNINDNIGFHPGVVPTSSFGPVCGPNGCF